MSKFDSTSQHHTIYVTLLIGEVHSTHLNNNAADYLCLHIAISADVEAVEDDVEVAGWSRHQQEKEVEVGVAEQTL